jgi:hypothetical protein
LYVAEPARRIVIGVVVGLGRKRDDAKKARKKRIYICKKKKKTCIPFFVLFCSTNWLAAERPQHYTTQCACKDLIIIIEDGIKIRRKELHRRVVG